MRVHNIALLLGVIAGAPRVSRVELAERTGLTKATVSSLVSELVEGGLVRDIGPESGHRPGRSVGAAPVALPGRPAGRLILNEYGPLAIGLQLATDHVAGCLLDLSGRLRARELRRIEPVDRTPGELARLARPLLRRLFDEATTAGQVVAGVSVTVPGPVTGDDEGRRVLAGVVPAGWSGVDLLAVVGAEVAGLELHGVQVSVEGEVVCAALAERTELPGSWRRDVLYVGGESTLGAAVLDDRLVRTQGLYRGATGAAGDLGHLPVRRSGPQCACGRRGCLECYAGRGAMAVAAGLAEPGPARLITRDRLAGLVEDPAAERAHRAVARAADAVADAVLLARVLLDFSGVVLGGRLAGLGAVFHRRLVDRLPGLPVRVGVLGPDAALRGAAAGVLDRIVADPIPWLDAQDG